MADRPFVLETGRVGVETTPGTAVPATKKLTSLGWIIGPKFTFKPVVPVGYKIGTAVVAGQEYSDISYSAPNAFFEDLAYLFDGAIKTVSPTRIIPSTGLAYSRVYAPNASGLDAQKAYTLEHGSSVRVEQIAGMVIDTVHLAWSRAGVTCDGKAFGRAMTSGFTLSGGTTETDTMPITGNSIDCYLDPTSGALGSTKLLRQFDGDLALGPHFGMIWPLDSTKTSYDGTVEKAFPAAFKITVGADSAGMAILDNCRLGSKMFIRNVIKGPLIETGTPDNYYLLQVDIAAEVSNINPLSDRDGVTSITWEFQAIEDATWGKPYQITLVNQLAAL